MKDTSTALRYGLFLWLIPFAVGFLLYPLREQERPLFESIMPVVVTLCTTIFTLRYFRKIDGAYLREGVLLGVCWFLICIAIDLLLFTWGPMHMSVLDYFKDIGLTYLIIPTITVGSALLLGRKG
jgi:EamA domain-containing membrane protein RarD